MCRLVSLLVFVALASGWTWPVEGEVLARYRNGADPYAAGMHRGIDIAARPGTPVVAAAAGRVRFAGVAGSSGVTVSVRTPRFDTSYLHLSGLSVRPGTRVGEGARIGFAGVSGRRSSQRAHLHFGVRTARTDHDYRDPLTLLPPPARGKPRRVPAPAPVPVRAPRPEHAPHPGLAPRPGLAPHPVPRPFALGPRPGAEPVGEVPRIWWLLGCLSLLALGTALGHPEASARAARRTRAWAGARLGLARG